MFLLVITMVECTHRDTPFINRILPIAMNVAIKDDDSLILIKKIAKIPHGWVAVSFICFGRFRMKFSNFTSVRMIYALQTTLNTQKGHARTNFGFIPSSIFRIFASYASITSTD